MLDVIQEILTEEKYEGLFVPIGKIIERVLTQDPEKKYVCGYKLEQGNRAIINKGKKYFRPKVTINFNMGYGSPNWPMTMAERNRAEAIMNEVQDKILNVIGIYVDMYGENTPNCQEKKSIQESELPLNVRRRINYDEENIINLLKKFALRHSGRNVKIHILTRLACKDVAYELLDGTQLQFGDKEYMYVEDVLIDYLEEKYGKQIEEFITDFYSDGGDELGSKYVFQKHSERYGGNGFSEGYETWNMLLRVYASWFPDLNWKELKEKLDGMDSGGKILIKKPGDINNGMGYYFSLQRFDAK